MSTAVKTRPAAKTPANFYRANTWKREDSIGYLMGRSFTLMKEAVDVQLGPSGLTHAQWVPLLKLYHGEASTVAELGRTCQIDAGAMTRTLDRLEMKGLVQRVRSSEDRRVVHLELTQEGRETAKAIPAALSRAMNALLAGFTQDEWQTLKSLLSRVLANAVELQEEQEGKNPG
jgi:DNA-binding MarR family transcriptional regulator